MSRLRSFLATALLLFAATASAQVYPGRPGFSPGFRPGFQFLSGALTPAFTTDFTKSETLDSRITFARAGLAMRTDGTGKLTYAPNNLLTYSNDLTNAAWVKMTATITSGVADPLGGNNAFTVTATGANSRFYQVVGSLSVGSKPIYSVFVRRRSGTGTITFQDPNVGTGPTITPTASWTQVFEQVALGSATGYPGVYINTSGDAIDVFMGVYAQVTYETSPRTADQVITTTAAYYGPRFDYDPSTLAAKGLLIEEARTGVVLWNRDLTNAAWTKTNATAAKDQTGVDGAANSASSLTATATNGTATQSITLASSARFQSAYIERITGSGAVSMTMDGGTTWTALTLTAAWTRISIPTQTIANPAIGFQLATSGDKIGVDLVQNENGTFATSAIPTTSASVTRAAETASITGTNFSSWYNALGGSVVTESDTFGSGTNFLTIWQFDTDASNRVLFRNTSVQQPVSVVGGSVVASVTAGAFAVNTMTKSAATFANNNFAGVLAGGSVATATSGAIPPAMTSLRLGSANASEFLNGHLKSFKYFYPPLANTVLQGQTQ